MKNASEFCLSTASHQKKSSQFENAKRERLLLWGGSSSTTTAWKAYRGSAAPDATSVWLCSRGTGRASPFGGLSGSTESVQNQHQHLPSPSPTLSASSGRCRHNYHSCRRTVHPTEPPHHIMYMPLSTASTFFCHPSS